MMLQMAIFLPTSTIAQVMCIYWILVVPLISWWKVRPCQLNMFLSSGVEICWFLMPPPRGKFYIVLWISRRCLALQIYQKSSLFCRITDMEYNAGSSFEINCKKPWNLGFDTPSRLTLKVLLSSIWTLLLASGLVYGNGVKLNWPTFYHKFVYLIHYHTSMSKLPFKDL